MQKKHDRSPGFTLVSFRDWSALDIRFTHARSAYKTTAGLHRASDTQDVVRLHAGIKGNYNVYYPVMEKGFELIGGHINLLYSHPFEMEFENKTAEIETFGIQFPVAIFLPWARAAGGALARFARQVERGTAAILSDYWGTLDLETQQTINDILHCPYGDDLQKLFYLSKSIELLTQTAASCAHAGDKSKVFLKSRSDKEKVIAARDLVNARLHLPPTLPEVARQVGLNEYKLKKGFLELFGTTLFEYLTNQRLQLAKAYLLDTQKSVAEIAYESGYKTPQHFNNAFKKKFGVPPNLIRKNP